MCMLSDMRDLLPNAFQSKFSNLCAWSLSNNLVLAAPNTVACHLPLAYPLCWLHKKKLGDLGRIWVE